MSKTINFQIIKADNGWVVKTFGPNGQDGDTLLVMDDQDLAGTIAAALVAQRLGAADTFTTTYHPVYGAAIMSQSLDASEYAKQLARTTTTSVTGLSYANPTGIISKLMRLVRK